MVKTMTRGIIKKRANHCMKVDSLPNTTIYVIDIIISSQQNSTRPILVFL